MHTYRLPDGDVRTSHLAPNELPEEYAGWVHLPDGLPKPTPTNADVNAECDRRIYEGATFQLPGNGPIRVTGRPQDQVTLMAQHSRAHAHIVAGEPDAPMVYRCADNIVHNLTATQMRKLVEDGFNYVEDVRIACWHMKDKTNGHPDGIPDDFTDDRHWPAYGAPAP